MRPIAIDPTRLPLSLALDLVLQVQPDDEHFTDCLGDEYSKFGEMEESMEVGKKYKCLLTTGVCVGDDGQMTGERPTRL